MTVTVSTPPAPAAHAREAVVGKRFWRERVASLEAGISRLFAAEREALSAGDVGQALSLCHRRRELRDEKVRAELRLIRG